MCDRHLDSTSDGDEQDCSNYANRLRYDAGSGSKQQFLIHTANADSRQRRRCEQNSQLARDDHRRIRLTIWKPTKLTP